MWKSPIEFIESEIEAKLEDAVFEAVQKVGIHVDREELLRALAYDRGQYELGYEEGVEDAESKIVRCIDCKYRHDGLECKYEGMVMEKTPPRCDKMFGFIDDDGWCYKGKRKDE